MLYLITVPPFHTIWELLLLGARSHPPFIMKQSSGWHHLQILTDFDKIIDFRCFMKVKASLFISGKNIWISFLPAVVVQHRLAAVDLNFDLTHFASLPPFCKQTRRLLRAADARVFCDFLLWFRYLWHLLAWLISANLDDHDTPWRQVLPRLALRPLKARAPKHWRQWSQP